MFSRYKSYYDYGNSPDYCTIEDQLNMLSKEIATYWMKPETKEAYTDMKGEDVSNCFLVFINKQANSDTYTAYTDKDLCKYYRINRYAVYKLMTYYFLSVGNPDIQPLKAYLYDNKKKLYTKFFEDYSFLNQIIRLPNSFKAETFEKLFANLDYSPLYCVQREDGFGYLLTCPVLSDEIKQERLDIMLTKLDEDTVEIEMYDALKSAIRNGPQTYIDLIRYLYCIDPKTSTERMANIVLLMADSTSAEDTFYNPFKKIDEITDMMKFIFTIIDNSFLTECNRYNVTFDKVLSYYTRLRQEITRLKADRQAYIDDKDWNNYGVVDKQLKNLKCTFSPIVAMYFFSKFGKDMYLSNEAGLNMYVDELLSKVDSIISRFHKYILNADITNYALQALYGCLGELYRRKVCCKKIYNCFTELLKKNIDKTIIIKAFIRGCTHAELTYDSELHDHIRILQNKCKETSDVYRVIQQFTGDDGKERKIVNRRVYNKFY